jgi:hypothetical protein
MRNVFLSIVVAISCVACGGVSRQDARNQATQKACDKYNECTQIGEGKIYASRDACEVDQTAAWERTWPVTICEARIDKTAFDLCINAIQVTECGSVADLINVYFNKCTAQNVCGASDAGT